MTDAFFLPRRDEPRAFDATELTRGPWSSEHQHGGPPAALMARGMRHQAEGDFDTPVHLARVTVEFLRPVPIGVVSLAVSPLGGGRSVRRYAATLSASGREVACATCVAMRVAEIELPASTTSASSHALPVPSPDACEPYEFSFFRDAVGYHKAMEVRFARGEHGEGRVFAWLRMRVPLVSDEAPSPVERTLAAADSGNGVSWTIDPKDYLFVNPDLTVYLHRPLEGEWIGLDAESTYSTAGVGLADSRLWDASGHVGRGVQSLFVAAR